MFTLNFLRHNKFSFVQQAVKTKLNGFGERIAKKNVPFRLAHEKCDSPKIPSHCLILKLFSVQFKFFW